MRVEVGKDVTLLDGRVIPGHRFRAFNGITGQEIPYCIMADDETGEYLKYALEDGKPYVAVDDQGRKLDKVNAQAPTVKGRLEKIVLVPPKQKQEGT